MTETRKLDLADPRVRKMADENHQPREIWSGIGKLHDVVCQTCSLAWPCDTRRALDGLDAYKAAKPEPEPEPASPFPLTGRAAKAAELRRREIWRNRLSRYLGGDSREYDPTSWQLDLAARILSRLYRWSVTGRSDIWVMAQTTASELADDMQADGRLNQWGNWPHD